jgi:deoxyinosine 3'endonuclease (endonuclease V)
MKIALDVKYHPNGWATTGAVVFEDWQSTSIVADYVKHRSSVEPYIPGQFYKRELPCLEDILIEPMKQYDIDTFIIDGYVNLTTGDGLGKHLYNMLLDKGHTNFSVVGVAKSSFKLASGTEVLRGGSVRPLYVTSEGISEQEAAQYVQQMSGPYRIPTMLKYADALPAGAVV